MRIEYRASLLPQKSVVKKQAANIYKKIAQQIKSVSYTALPLYSAASRTRLLRYPSQEEKQDEEIWTSKG
jgi:hypothetical protein